MTDLSLPQVGTPDASLADAPVTLSPEKAAELITQKQRANAEAKANADARKAAEKERDELRAKVQAIEDRDKTELQRLQEQAANSAKEVALARQQALSATRQMTAIRHGAADAEYVSWKIEQAQIANPDLDVDQYVLELKKSNPALFGSPARPAQATGNAAPHTAGGNGSIDARLAEIQRELAAIPHGSVATAPRRMQLQEEARLLRNKAGR